MTMEDKTQKNTINTLYFILVLSTILGFVPNSWAFTVSFTLWVVVLLAAYVYRGKDNKDGLLYNHMTYLIGTIWIGTSFILIGTLAAGWWVFTQGDNSAFDAAIARMEGGAMIDEAAILQTLKEYFAGNRTLMITASTVAIGPAILYFVYRVANGISRAGKGYRIANPKSWL